MHKYSLQITNEETILIEPVIEKKSESQFDLPDSPVSTHAYRIVECSTIKSNFKIGAVVMIEPGEYGRVALNGKDYFVIRPTNIIGYLKEVNG